MPRTTTRAYAATAAVLSGVLLVSSGCSSDDAAAPEASPSTTPTSAPASTAPASTAPAPSEPTASGSASQAADGPAARRLARAVARLGAQNTGRYRSFVTIPGIRITEEGKYQLQPMAYDATRVYQPVRNGRPVPSGNLTVRMIVVDGRLWARFIDDGGDSGGSRCYLALDGPVATVAGLDIDNTQPPAAVTAVLEAAGNRRRGSSIIGTTDLVTGVGLLGQRVVAAALGEAQPIGARLPALFSLKGGRIANWQTNLSQLATALRGTGRPVPDFVKGLARTAAPAAVFLDQPALSGRPAGATTTDGPIQPPDPGSVVTPTDDSEAAIRAALAGCPLD